jgi:thioredoxin 1
MAYSAEYSAGEPARAEIDQMPGALVLEFGAPWCGHCIGAQSLIEASLAGRPAVQHLKIEDGRGRPLGRSYAIKLWPTLVFLRNGVEQARVTRPHDVEPLLQALGKIVD